MSQDAIEAVCAEILSKYAHLTAGAVTFGIDYLKQFNYINGGKLTPEVIKKAVKDFQERFGIDPDGDIGPHTLRAMAYPRCGCSDAEKLVEDATKPNKWGYKNLKLYIEDYVPGLTKDEMESIIKDVFSKVSKVIDVTFELTKKTSEANFIVRVSSDPREELGSPSGVLAFQYLPPSFNYTGEALEGVFDGAENWVGDRGGKGIKFRNVFTHEVIGHGLGLQHSKVKTALMAPFYDPDVAFLVSPDDVERLVALYGAAKDAPPVVPPVTPPQEGLSTVALKIRNNKVENVEIDGSLYRLTKIT